MTMTPLDLDGPAGLDGLTDRDRLRPAPGWPHDYVPCEHCTRCLRCVEHHHPGLAATDG